MMGITFFSLAFLSINAFLCVDAGISYNYNYVGSHLQLNCTLPLSKQKAVDLKFKKKQKFQTYTDGSYKDVDSHLIKIIDDSTAALNWVNISSNDTGEYICLSPNESSKPLGQFDVKVQYKPQNITNFNCFMMNWNEYLFCSWEHPVPYNWELNDTHISLKYSATAANKQVYNCPQLTRSNCTWPEPRGNWGYVFCITVKNTVSSDTATSTFIVISSEIVKPSQVNIFVTELEEKNCFNISWKYYETMSSEIERFEIHHQGPEDKEMKQIKDLSGNESFWEKCDMKPYTTHTFSVICQASSSKLKSDHNLLTYQTPEKAPSSGPVSVNGSYTSGPCVNNTRFVTVYWKQVESKARNGIITNYTLKVKLKHSYSRTVGPDVHQASLVMPCNSVEFVEISASTIAGLSEKPTVWAIAPSDIKVPSIVENSLAVNGSLLRVSWDSASQAGVSFTYAVFWIKDTTSSPNKLEMSWAVIEGNKSYYDIASEDDDLKIGIAVSNNSNGWWSPIFWTPCVFKESSLSKFTFEVDVVTKRGSAIVSWELPCSKTYRYKNSTFVILYHLEAEGRAKSVRVEIPSSSESPHIINNLLSDGTYQFGMSVKDGEREEQVAHWKKVLTLRDSEEDTTISTIVVAVICLSAVVVLVAIIFFIRCCMKAGKKVKGWSRSDEDSGVYLLPEHCSADDNSSVKSTLCDPSNLLHVGPDCNLKNTVTAPLKSILVQKDTTKAVESNLIPFEHKPLPPPVEILLEKIHAEGITPYTVIKSANLELRQQFDNKEVGIESTTDRGQNPHNFSCKEYVKVGENKSLVNDPSGTVLLVKAIGIPDKQLALAVSGRNSIGDNTTGIHYVKNVSCCKNVPQCKDYVTIGEKESLTNQSSVSSDVTDLHVKDLDNLTVNGNSVPNTPSAPRDLSVINLDYVTVSVNGLTNYPSVQRVLPMKNLNYVTVNENSVTNTPSSPRDLPVKNLNYVTVNKNSVTNTPSAQRDLSVKNLDYVRVSENGLTTQPSAQRDLPVKNLDYVTVNENGLTNQPSAQRDLPVKNLDYVTVNENGLTNQPSAQRDLPVKNLDYVTVNENGLTNQPSAQRDLPVKNLDYVTVNENGLTNQPSAQRDLPVKNLDYVTVNENGLTNQPSAQRDLPVKNLDYVTVNENGLTNQPSAQRDLPVKYLDYVTVNENGLTNQPSAQRDLSVKNLDYVTVNENGLTNQPSAQRDLPVKYLDYVTVNENGLTNQPSAQRDLSVKNLDYVTSENGLTNQTSPPSNAKILNKKCAVIQVIKNTGQMIDESSAYDSVHCNDSDFKEEDDQELLVNNKFTFSGQPNHISTDSSLVVTNCNPYIELKESDQPNHISTDSYLAVSDCNPYIQLKESDQPNHISTDSYLAVSDCNPYIQLKESGQPNHISTDSYLAVSDCNPYIQLKESGQSNHIFTDSSLVVTDCNPYIQLKQSGQPSHISDSSLVVTNSNPYNQLKESDLPNHITTDSLLVSDSNPYYKPLTKLAQPIFSSADSIIEKSFEESALGTEASSICQASGVQQVTIPNGSLRLFQEYVTTV